MKGFTKATKRIALALSIVLVLSMVASSGPVVYTSAEEGTVAIAESDLLQADGKNLKNAKGEIVNLRGTNAGGYLLQEFWMTPTKTTDNVRDEKTIYDVLEERFGKETMMELIDSYQNSYWTEKDFDRCAELGMNVIRLPFWWRNLVDKNGNFYGYDAEKDDPYAEAFKRMDWFVKEAGDRGMYVILDFHGAPGSQNGSDHSGALEPDDSKKEEASEFFFGDNAEANQKLYYQIWGVIAERYKDNPAVAGYDLLNEPYCTYRYTSGLGEDKLHELLWGVYDEAYKTIRNINDNHVIIMEATWDPADLPDPADYKWENVMYEYHNYLYDDYDNVAGQQIANMEAKLISIANRDYDLPSYIGEFSYFNQPDTWDEGLALLNSYGINWTTWTYKTVKEYGMWGLYHHTEEFNNRINLETASLDEIKEFYGRMGEVEENTDLTNVAKKYFDAAAVESKLSPVLSDVEAGAYYFAGFNSNRVLTINTEADGLVAASAAKINETDVQKFTLIRNEDSTVSLQSVANNKYVSLGEDNILRATADVIGDTEKFLMIKASETTVAFRSVVNKKYACADENLADEFGIPIIADRDSAGWWETFYIYDMDKKLLGGTINEGYSGWNCQEAEDAAIAGGNITADNADNFSNGQAVANLGTDRTFDEIDSDWSNINYIAFDVEADTAGTYQMVLRYNGDDDKTILVKVNDEEAKEVSIPNVLPEHNWDVMHDKYITVDLQAGNNTIYISGTIAGEGWMNIDRIDISKQAVTENEIDGKVYERYEAEKFNSTGSLEAGDFCSNGYTVGSMNSGTAFEDIDDTWSNIKYVDFVLFAQKAGEYQIVMRYNGNGADGMTAVYRVNGGENQKLILNNAGNDWNVMNTVDFTVTLEEGFNDLMISGTIAEQSNWANIDCIDTRVNEGTLEPDEPGVEKPKPDKIKEFKVNGITYKVTKAAAANSNGTVKVTKADTSLKEAVIPATVKKNSVKYKVASISAGAFSGCKKLKTVTLGKNIKSIPANAFKKCAKLSKLKLKAKLSSVKKGAFSGCKQTITVSGTSAKANVKTLKKSGYKKFKK